MCHCPGVEDECVTVQVLKMMVGNNLKDTQLQQIVDKTILFHDKVCSFCQAAQVLSSWLKETGSRESFGLSFALSFSQGQNYGRGWLLNFFDYLLRFSVFQCKIIEDH
jgi:hypothetical protein